MDAPGSTKLSQEQAEWYEDRYGIRFTHVADRPPSFRDSEGKVHVRANRKQRRAQRRQK